MAVGKSKTSRARRDARRASNFKLKSPSLAVDPFTGETHRRHHVTRQGYLRGKLVVSKASREQADT